MYFNEDMIVAVVITFTVNELQINPKKKNNRDFNRMKMKKKWG